MEHYYYLQSSNLKPFKASTRWKKNIVHVHNNFQPRNAKFPIWWRIRALRVRTARNQEPTALG